MDAQRLRAAYEKARRDLLAERVPAGHWVGELSTSALSTATAVSALSLVRREARQHGAGQQGAADVGQLDQLIARGTAWLTGHQNDDGGWGDTDRSYSNVATTMLGVAAIHLAGEDSEHRERLARAKRYLETLGGIAALRKRYGPDKTFAVPILTNAALAGLVSWRDVSPLPFEFACVPQHWYRLLQLPVVSYAIPALVAIGQARYFHLPPWNPVWRWWRGKAVEGSLRVLQRMQPASGGYLEAVPLTSFVVMSLAGTGRADHPVARLGLKFLIDSVRPDGSWPIDTNLATWTTTLAINALGDGGEDVSTLGRDCWQWLLACQHRERHAYTGAEPGGWGWSDLSGAVPDADDTPGALLALAHLRDAPLVSDADRAVATDSARCGLIWLLGLQNRDGGWPTFCRGWGKLPFDRSGSDLTAHAIRAIHAWRDLIAADATLAARGPVAMERGFRFLASRQQADGSWSPLWFGNQDDPDETNLVYGTAKVLRAFVEAGRERVPQAISGWRWLARAQNGDSGWSTPRSRDNSAVSSVEETALAVDALLDAARAPERDQAVARGLDWLVERVERDEHRQPAPIGFYFAKLWYHERLYPLVFTAGTLGRAVMKVGAPDRHAVAPRTRV